MRTNESLLILDNLVERVVWWACTAECR